MCWHVNGHLLLDEGVLLCILWGLSVGYKMETAREREIRSMPAVVEQYRCFSEGFKSRGVYELSAELLKILRLGTAWKSGTPPQGAQVALSGHHSRCASPRRMLCASLLVCSGSHSKVRNCYLAWHMRG